MRGDNRVLERRQGTKVKMEAAVQISQILCFQRRLPADVPPIYNLWFFTHLLGDAADAR